MAELKKSASFFEVFVEYFGLGDGSIETGIVYPPNFVGDGLLGKLQKMCFPGDYRPVEIECFSFVITDIDASRRYGHVRLCEKDGVQHALCILTRLNWFDSFYRFLNEISNILARSSRNDPEPFLARAISESAQILDCSPGQAYELVHSETELCSLTVPPVCPTLKQSPILFEYFSAAKPITILRVFGHFLHERRVLFVSRRLSRLTSCIHAASNLIYPFIWQHLFIPVLPDTLIDYLQAPMPFVIGIHESLYVKMVRGRMDLGDCCVVKLDSNTIESEYDDLLSLPNDMLIHFRRSFQLERSDLRSVSDKQSSAAGSATNSRENAALAANYDNLSAVFLRAMAICLGDYRDYFIMQPGEPVTFDEERFFTSHHSDSNSNSSSNPNFYDSLRSLQMFRQFIDDRLMRAVSDTEKQVAVGEEDGIWLDDPFELEVRTVHRKSAETDRRYRAWLAASRDRLTDFADRMKSKSKELQQRLRDEVRKTQQSVSNAAHNSSAPNLPTSVNDPSKRYAIKSKLNNTVQAVPVAADPEYSGHVIKATVLNLDEPSKLAESFSRQLGLFDDRESSDLLIELAPSGESAAIAEVRQKAAPSVAQAPSASASAEESLLLDFSGMERSQPVNNSSLSVLDQFDPLLSTSASLNSSANTNASMTSTNTNNLFQSAALPRPGPMNAYMQTSFGLNPAAGMASSYRQPMPFQGYTQAQMPMFGVRSPFHVGASPLPALTSSPMQARIGSNFGSSQLPNDDDLIGL